MSLISLVISISKIISEINICISGCCSLYLACLRLHIYDCFEKKKEDKCNIKNRITLSNNTIKQNFLFSIGLIFRLMGGYRFISFRDRLVVARSFLMLLFILFVIFLWTNTYLFYLNKLHSLWKRCLYGCTRVYWYKNMVIYCSLLLYSDRFS